MRFFLLLLFSLPLYAQNFMPLSVINAKGTAGFSTMQACTDSSHEECVDVADPQLVQLGFFALEDIKGNGAPVYSAKENETTCADAGECQTVGRTLCKDLEDYQFFFAEKGASFEAYCAKVTGYTQVKVGTKFVPDLTKKTAYTTAQLQKAQFEGAVGQAIKAMDCGRRVIAVLLVRNATKNLSTTQVGQMVATYDQPRSLLETGSLVSAKELITSLQVDGTLVTEGDKLALTSEIDKCKP